MKRPTITCGLAETQQVNTYNMKELIEIQNELKAPKNQRNTFGNYNYRSAEDILEAVKPLLKKYNCCLTITDEIKQLGDRYYVEATATLCSSDGDRFIAVSAYAREEENKKGMDASQITGSTSSYARKYALNGLFCIDDTKDADFTNTHEKAEQPRAGSRPSRSDAKDKLMKELEDATSELGKCKDDKSIDEVVKAHKLLWTNQDFKDSVAKRRKELTK